MVLRAPAPSTSICPGKFGELQLSIDLPPDFLHALGPRVDSRQGRYRGNVRMKNERHTVFTDFISDTREKLQKVGRLFRCGHSWTGLRAGSLVWGICVRQSWQQPPASRRAKRAGERNGPRKSEPARKPLNFEFRPCEVTGLNCQGIKYLTNTSEAKCKQTRLWQAVTAKSLSTCTGPNSFQYHRIREVVWSVLEMYGRVTKIIWSVLEMFGRVLESYG